MRFGEVFDYRTAEEAKVFIGKAGVFSDHLLDIIEEPEGRRIGTLVDADIKNVFPFISQDEDNKRTSFQFLRPVLEDNELMSNRQLAEWLAKGNGECSFKDSKEAFFSWPYSRDYQDEPVEDCIFIRRWRDTEWSKPTKSIYEEDCLPDTVINKEDCE